MWAGQGGPTQRRVAAYPFSGELGARYPVEATKRLSQLANQHEPLTTMAFARLFATLATQEGDAVVVLGELRRRMADKTDKQSADLVMDTVIELVSARDLRSGRPAVAVFLQDNPGVPTISGRSGRGPCTCALGVTAPSGRWSAQPRRSPSLRSGSKRNRSRLSRRTIWRDLLAPRSEENCRKPSASHSGSTSCGGPRPTAAKSGARAPEQRF